ncbi:hypothetical protein ACOSP7_023939 [Xanthoceras sorbifolium]
MSSKKTAGLGVVVRDSLGFVLLVAVKPVVGDFYDQSLVYSFVHVRRSANRVGHQLVTLALSVDQQFVWLEDYPSCVGSYVASDFPCNL